MNHILIIDDQQSLLTALEMLFSNEGYEVETACGGGEGLARLSEGKPPDIMITDVKMPEVDGIKVLRAAKKLDPYLPVVLITAHADFLEKPFANKHLLEICREALEFGKADRRYSDRKRELSSAHHPEMPVGEAECFKAAMELATKAAETNSTILIQGDNGTGKELVALRGATGYPARKRTFRPCQGLVHRGGLQQRRPF